MRLYLIFMAILVISFIQCNTANQELKIDKVISFEFSTSTSADLSDNLKKYLDKVAIYLEEHPGAVLGITGHSDNQGTFEENHKRSVARARAVKDYLLNKGIPAEQLLASGKGSIEPVASNKTEEGRRKNRRVDIRIIPPPKNIRSR